MRIRIDYSNMIGAAVGGIGETEWAGSAATFAEAHSGFARLRRAGEVGFADVVRDQALREQPISFAARSRGRYRDVVILGIGGSALGPIALRTALRPSGWNMLDDEARKGYPRMHVLDNVDPETIAALLDRLELATTLFVVTSKSGGTAETMSQFLVVHERLAARSVSIADHFVFVTDPKQGALRPLAAELGAPALDIPPSVGGRFSVLTPVGTLPAALVGIDVNALLDGAADMVAQCDTATLSQNPAGVYAMLQWLANTRHGKVINVLMPYSDPLRDFAAWFVQLWAESLGKLKSDGSSVGQTPLAALGATDQHSQVQLFMEGPKDKTVTFVSVAQRAADVTIPKGFGSVKELGYLGGHTLSELIDIEHRATAGALARRGRPNMTIHLDRVDEWHVGGLIMLLELATAYSGQLYGINAFDQPGVELGKQFAYALLGRPGADDARKEWESLPASDPRWSV
ncbi:MAG TPA: glucose-6-phosphate isomerase [Gemmatimonadaceae bacterium]|nr:glucose-6-phosphate isomerase [Gemmatimonadaceae bacterium]